MYLHTNVMCIEIISRFIFMASEQSLKQQQHDDYPMHRNIRSGYLQIEHVDDIRYLPIDISFITFVLDYVTSRQEWYM